MWEGWAAQDRSSGRPMAHRAVTRLSRKRWSGKDLCCIGSMNFATRSAVASAGSRTRTQVSRADGVIAGRNRRARPGCPSLLGSACCLTVRPGSLRGAIRIWHAGSPNAAQPVLLTVSNPYIRPARGEMQGKAANRPNAPQTLPKSRHSRPPAGLGYARRPRIGRSRLPAAAYRQQPCGGMYRTLNFL